MLQETIEKRKKLFVDYNGSYTTYVKNSGKTVPNIIVIMNNYEVFSESYYDYEDMILQLSRDGLKYGIIFILTTSGTNTVKYRLRQNFKQELVLQMNDTSDYISILGNTNKVYPSKAKGRGLVKYDYVYEFQTAYPYKEAEQTEYIKQIVAKLNEAYPNKAKAVPILPEKVTLSFVKDYLLDLASIPIGVQKGQLGIESFDFKSKYATLIIGNEIEFYKPFANALVMEFYTLNKASLFVFDTMEMLKVEVINKVGALTSGFDDKTIKIIDYIDECHKIYIENNYNRAVLKDKKPVSWIIIGLSDWISRLGMDAKDKFTSTIEKGKDLEILNLVFYDSLSNLKKLEYESWYKTIISNNRGIWLGNGIADQFTIKLSRTPRELREIIDVNFAYSIKNGVATLIKVIEYQDTDLITDKEEHLE